MGEQLNQFCVLPYAGLAAENRVGPFVFWPWNDSYSEKYIPDPILRDRVSQEITRHVSLLGKPLSTQCLVSVNDRQSNHLARGEEDCLNAALGLLALAYLLPVVNQNAPVPEHFQAFVTPLIDQGQHYPVVSRGLHELTNVIVPSGVPFLRFQVPREVDGCSMSQRRYFCGFAGHTPNLFQGISSELPDGEIMCLADRLLQSPVAPESVRAFRAVWWHNFSVRQDETLDPGQRAIALGTAFEILFDLGRSVSKKRPVCEQVDRLLSSSGEHRFTVNERKPYRVTRTSYVTYKLFQWRNKVVHGEDYDIMDGTIRVRGWGRRNLVLVASRVFGRCFKAMLSCYGSSVRV